MITRALIIRQPLTREQAATTIDYHQVQDLALLACPGMASHIEKLEQQNTPQSTTHQETE